MKKILKIHQTFRILQTDLDTINAICKLSKLKKQDWYEAAITEKLNRDKGKLQAVAQTMNNADIVPQNKPKSKGFVPQKTIIVPQNDVVFVNGMPTVRKNR